MKWFPIALLLLALAPIASAQIAGHGNSNEDCKPPEVFIGLLGVTSAGNVEVCLTYPAYVETISSTFTASITLTGPAAAGAGTPTFTVTWLPQSGCNVATQTNGGAGGTGFSTQFFSRDTFTMTAQQCNARVTFDYKNGAGTSLNTDSFDFTVLAYDTYTRAQDHLCSGSLSTCNIAQIANCNASDAAGTNTCKDPDIREFLCADSTADPLVPGSCNRLTVNVAQSGTWTVTNAGTQAITLSGTTHQIIDSWPSLVSSVTNSGTLSVTNSGSQTFTISAWPAITGSLTVTNAGGQSITVTSWPQLNAALSGAVTIHQDQACGATIVCKGNTTFMVKGNVTTITNVVAFDWSAFIIRYAPLAFAIIGYAVYWRTKDGGFGLIGILFTLASMVLYPFSLVVKVGFVGLLIYLVVSMVWRRKHGGMKLL